MTPEQTRLLEQVVELIKLSLQAGIDAERERCAKVSERFKVNLDDARSAQNQLAALIRDGDGQTETGGGT